MLYIPIWTLLPFLFILLATATMPLFAGSFWEKNKNKLIISLGCALPIVALLVINNMWGELYHAVVLDYIPFVILLGSLFTITGGIVIRGDVQATPVVNALILLIGGVLASIVGTTGASMLLVRTLIQTNSERHFKAHTIVFFIMVVANCGGLLTPIGDPPLFILYLRGVEFFWFLNLFPEWIFVNVLLIFTYIAVDAYYYSKESIASIVIDRIQIRPIRIHGGMNFLWLLGVVASVAFINPQYFPVIENIKPLQFVREAVILLCAFGAYRTTKKEYRIANEFSWHPIQEVAYLFIGIFITVIPCILYLKAHAGEFGLSTAPMYYYATGLLSSFLDNAPTAITFYSIATGIPVEQGVTMVAGVPEIILKAIATSSVFFGAMTYVGNGPNFMIKAIAEHSGINMPSFFGYMLRYAIPILLPLYVIAQLLFLL